MRPQNLSNLLLVVLIAVMLFGINSLSKLNQNVIGHFSGNLNAPSRIKVHLDGNDYERSVERERKNRQRLESTLRGLVSPIGGDVSVNKIRVHDEATGNWRDRTIAVFSLLSETATHANKTAIRESTELLTYIKGEHISFVALESE